MDYYGYAGSLLYVNLTSGRIRKEPLDINLARKFIGGAGLNYKLAYDLIKPDDDPLSPNSPIILGVGPLVGTLVPGASKLQATVKLPVPASKDNRFSIATATSGTAQFGHLMKSAGYDHIIITGRAKKPVYLKIIDDNVEICDASDLWGKKDIIETTDELIARHGTCGVLAIGRGGENLIRQTLAFCDYRRHLGRNGFGAIMGSKNLKAIVVSGTKGIKVKDPMRLMKAVNAIHERNARMPMLGKYHKLGYNAAWYSFIMPNMNPGNWLTSKWDALYGNDAVWNKIYKTSHGCNGCFIGCKSAVQVPDGKYKGLFAQSSHLLAPCIVGQRLDITDYRKTLKLMEMLNRAGVDWMTTTEMFDWVTRLYEEGKLTKKATGGLALSRSFGTYVALFEKLLERDGIGAAMANGWFTLSEWVRRDAATEYMQGNGIAKGTSCIYPARAAKLDPMRFTMGITNPRGGHSAQGHSYTAVPLQPLSGVERDARVNIGVPEDAMGRIFTPVPYAGAFNPARLTKYTEDRYAYFGSLGNCTVWATFGFLSIDMLADLYSAVTGLETNREELRKAGERAYNLYKMLNVRQGFTRKDDVPPPTWFKPLMAPDVPMVLTDYYRIKRITPEDIEKLKDDYYDERGWSKEEGIPTKEKLIDLGLEDIADCV